MIKEPIKTGGSKQKQLRIWKCHFDYEYNDSDKTYRITKLYSHPKEPEKKPSPKRYKKKEKDDDLRRQGNNNKYSKYIRPLLIDELIGHNDYSMDFSMNELLKSSGMVSGNFFTTLTHKKINELTGVEICEIDFFFNTIRRTSTNAILTSLNYLERNAMLSYKKIYYVIASGEHRPGTDLEVKIIESLNKNMLEYFNLKDDKDLFLSGRSLLFYRKINQELRNLLGLDGCYRKYSIKYLGMGTDRLSKEQRHEIRSQLNQTFIDAHLKKCLGSGMCINAQKKLLNDYVKL